MQVEELKNEGLRREYRITVDEQEISKRVDKLLENLRQQVRLKGFRPGKAPKSLLKRMHGKAVLDQVVQETVTENVEKLYQDKNVKPAIRPKMDIPELEDEAELQFTMELEILPQIEVDDFKPPKLTRYVAEADEKAVEEYLERLAEQQKRFEPAAKNYKAKTGDVVIIDFVGKQDGEPFERGSAEDYQLELGSEDLVPGFEDQLIGVKAGDEKVVKVTFPDDYAAEEFAGKETEFDVTVKEVRKPAEVEIDDRLAENLGMENLEGLRETVRQQVEQEIRQMSRARLKRSLLDALAETYDFEVPETMVEMEFRQIWEQIKQDLVQSGEIPADKIETLDEPEDDADKVEYRGLAERRVRLGLLLSEIGIANNVQVGREEMNRRIAEEARRYPGQEQQVFEFYQKNEQAQAQLRAPLYEDKVVDFILEMADIDDKKVSRDRLQALLEEDVEEKPKSSDTKKTTGKKTAAAKKQSDSKSRAGAKKSGNAKTSSAKKSGSKTKKPASASTGSKARGGTKGDTDKAKAAAPKKRGATGKANAKAGAKVDKSK